MELSMANQLLGATELGLVYGLMVLGVYITFRILKIPDLTVDGSVVLGMSVTAVVTNHGFPILALFLAALAGMAAGTVTGFLQTKLKIPPILAGILTMSGLYSINLLIMNGSPNVSMLGTNTVFSMLINATGVSKHAGNIIVGALVCGLVVLVIELFFRTRLGLYIRATGDNEEMVRSSSINADMSRIQGIMLSNALVAFSGALLCEQQRYADLNFGSGMLVVGLASVIIGQAFLGRRSVTGGLISAVLGSLAMVLLVAYLCYIIHAVVVYSTAVKTMGGLSPLKFFRGMLPAIMMAFSSAVGTWPSDQLESVFQEPSFAPV